MLSYYFFLFVRQLAGRKKYAFEVTGAYYANRLGLAEHLEKIKRQATAIFIREVGPEYYAPLGVGILREITRSAFQNKPEKFNTIEEAEAFMNSSNSLVKKTENKQIVNKVREVP